jgi:hypothetical protein
MTKLAGIYIKVSTIIILNYLVNRFNPVTIHLSLFIQIAIERFLIGENF